MLVYREVADGGPIWHEHEEGLVNPAGTLKNHCAVVASFQLACDTYHRSIAQHTATTMRLLTFIPIYIALASGLITASDPMQDAQLLIRRLNSDINDLIADFVQKNYTEATFDYVIMRQMFFASLSNLVLDDTGCRGFKIGPYPNTTTEVIQTLQKTQLGLNIVSQDLINKKPTKDDFCNGALGPFWSVSCFEGGDFAKNLNGSFSPPVGWICKQYRWNATTATSDVPQQRMVGWQEYL